MGLGFRILWLEFRVDGLGFGLRAHAFRGLGVELNVWVVCFLELGTMVQRLRVQGFHAHGLRA